jgi:hypothetical protein
MAVGLATALLAPVAVLAQGASPAADPGTAAAPQVQTVHGIDYLNGGAGEEARAAIDAQRSAFTLRIVFSVTSGAYAVADHVEIGNARGPLLAVDNAGPMLLVKLPAGDYTVAASHGGKTEQRKVHVGKASTTISWRWSYQERR